MDITQEKTPPPPPLINGKPSRWVTLALIERSTGIDAQDVNCLSTAISPKREWLTYRAFINQGDGTYLLQDAGPVPTYWPSKMIDSAVQRQTMRPDVAIIDPFIQIWRQVGQ